MNLAVLTTDTPHHRYFLQGLSKGLPSGVCVKICLLEEKPYPWGERTRRHFKVSLPNVWKGLVTNPYIQSKRQLRKQHDFEMANFFRDGNDSLPDAFPIKSVYSVNDSEAVDYLMEAMPDVALVFGSGVIRNHVFNIPRMGTINSHGGYLPDYRGLDTNLWAALEGHVEKMSIAIHKVDEGIDTGKLLMIDQISPVHGLDLHTLRYYTTLQCTEMYLELIRRLISGEANETPQGPGGRYYGPMPVVLKYKAGRIIRDWALKRTMAFDSV